MTGSMMEIEKKYRLQAERREEIVATLEELGAAYEGEDFEENTIYGGAALGDGGVVRIRTTERMSTLTFKRRVENTANVKQQIEHETEISDPAAGDRILRELGLAPKLIYEKRRRTWQLRDAEVVIDELPFGLFMEIEGSITSIKETEMLLDIEDLEPVHETYPMLTAQLGTSNGDIIESRFR